MRENHSILIGKEVEEDEPEGVPVCGGNLSSPVTDQVKYIEEIRYRIGSREYIENAD